MCDINPGCDPTVYIVGAVERCRSIACSMEEREGVGLSHVCSSVALSLPFVTSPPLAGVTTLSRQSRVVTVCRNTQRRLGSHVLR